MWFIFSFLKCPNKSQIRRTRLHSSRLLLCMPTIPKSCRICCPCITGASFPTCPSTVGYRMDHVSTPNYNP